MTSFTDNIVQLHNTDKAYPIKRANTCDFIKSFDHFYKTNGLLFYFIEVLKCILNEYHLKQTERKNV